MLVTEDTIAKEQGDDESGSGERKEESGLESLSKRSYQVAQ